MNYEQMSDFEINKAVAKCDPYVYEIHGSHPSTSESAVHIEGRNGKFGELYETDYDPCNNPSDAWPIIESNDISIILEDGEGLAMSEFEVISRCEGGGIDCLDECRHKNPLRAAMIVYLMMQEAL